MDSNTFDDDDHDSFQPSSSSSSSTSSRSSGDHDHPKAVHQLLEDGWFFGKLLVDVNTKLPIMLRCYSDPSPNFDQQILAKACRPPSEKSSLVTPAPANLTRAPSLPPNIGRSEEKIHQEVEISNSTTGKSRKSSMQYLSEQIFLIRKPSCVEKKECVKIREEKVASYSTTSTRRMKMMEGQSISSVPQHSTLLRTPSLPPYIGSWVDQEMNEENEITMSKLIRQAMPLSSDILPRQRSSKMVSPKYRPPRNSEVESSADALIRNSCDQTRHNRYPKNQRKLLEKSLSHIEFHKVQGFHQDLGFKFDKQNSNPPSMVEIFAGLQEKKKYNIKQDEDDKDGLKDPWQVKSCAASAPPIPVWAAKDSAQDVKAQLKFWARAVASNVR